MFEVPIAWSRGYWNIDLRQYKVKRSKFMPKKEVPEVTRADCEVLASGKRIYGPAKA
jgi:hypothetical protein